MEVGDGIQTMLFQLKQLIQKILPLGIKKGNGLMLNLPLTMTKVFILNCIKYTRVKL